MKSKDWNGKRHEMHTVKCMILFVVLAKRNMVRLMNQFCTSYWQTSYLFSTCLGLFSTVTDQYKLLFLENQTIQINVNKKYSLNYFIAASTRCWWSLCLARKATANAKRSPCSANSTLVSILVSSATQTLSRCHNPVWKNSKFLIMKT